MGVSLGRVQEVQCVDTAGTDTRNADDAKERLRESSRAVDSSQNSLYQVTLVGQPGTNHYFVGEPSQAPERVMLLMGRTGAGKTTIANWLLNFVYGVEFTDTYRFRLIEVKSQAQSDTTLVTAYTIYHQEGMRIPYTLTIVDTPGFLSMAKDGTGPLKADQEIREQLGKYFGVGADVDEVNCLHGVCILVKSSTTRHDTAEEYAFQCITQVFGEDIKNNIMIFFTFADHCETQAANVVEEAKVPYTGTFSFNNGDVLNVSAGQGAGKHYRDMHQIWWDIGQNETESFLKMLGELPEKASRLTRETIGERRKVERAVSSLELQIRSRLNELQTLEDIQDIVRKNAAKIDRKKNFKFSVEEEYLVKTSVTKQATNCQRCKFTCHYPCCTNDKRTRSRCIAMSLDGKCKHCPSKCSSEDHTTDTYVYERRLRHVEKSSEQFITEFSEAIGRIVASPSRSEQISRVLKDPFMNNALRDIMMKVGEIREGLQKLDDVALVKVPQNASDYIDLLVSKEEGRGAPGYMKRIKQLKKIKEEHQLLENIDQGRSQ
jgi:hypothetical protein